MEPGSARQRRSAVRYSNVAVASASPILSKANKVVEFHMPEIAFSTPAAVGAGAIVASVGSMQGWRKDNEDRHLLSAFADEGGFPGGKEGDDTKRQSVAVGVFDGHRGQDSAAFCAEHVGNAVIPIFQSIGAGTSGESTNVKSELLDRVVQAFHTVDTNLKGCLAEKEAAAASAAASQLSSPAAFAGSPTTTPGQSPQLSPRGPGSPSMLSLMISPHGTPTAPTGSSVGMSGTTAVVAICRRNEIVVLNVGDSRGYLIVKQAPTLEEIAQEEEGRRAYAAKLSEEGGVDGDRKVILPAGMHVIALSDDHRTSNEEENARITAAGGFIVNSRVNGKLSVTRAFGDFDLKGSAAKGSSDADKSPSTTQPLVICTPDVRRVDNLPISRATQGGSAFAAVLVGCDGVWELQSAEKIALRLHEKLRHLEEAAAASSTATDSSSPNLIEQYQTAVKTTIVEALHAGCAPFGDPTGRSPGSDNMSLGIVLMTAIPS